MSSRFTQGIVEAFKNHASKHFDSVVGKFMGNKPVINLPFSLTQQEFEDVCDAYGRYTFTFDQKLSNKTDHPVAAVGLIVGQYELDQVAAGKDCIEIGPSPDRISCKRHTCSLRDARDESRVSRSMNCFALDTGAQNKQNFACDKGFQNCEVEAKMAIGNHVYMSLDDVAKGMNNKGVDQVYLVMYLPVLLVMAQGFYKHLHYGMTKVGDMLNFFLGDHSLNYTHKYSEMIEYLLPGKTYPKYKFNLLIDVVKSIGPMYMVCVTKVKRGGVVSREICPEARSLVVVRDIIQYQNEIPGHRRMTKNEIESFKAKCEAFLMPREYYDSVVSYICSKNDDKQSRNGTVAYARGRLSKVSVGTHTIDKGYSLDASQFDNFTRNVEVDGVLRRMKQTMELGLAMRLMSKNWYSPIFHTINQSRAIAYAGLAFVMILVAFVSNVLMTSTECTTRTWTLDEVCHAITMRGNFSPLLGHITYMAESFINSVLFTINEFMLYLDDEPINLSKVFPLLGMLHPSITISWFTKFEMWDFEWSKLRFVTTCNDYGYDGPVALFWTLAYFLIIYSTWPDSMYTDKQLNMMDLYFESFTPKNQVVQLPDYCSKLGTLFGDTFDSHPGYGNCAFRMLSFLLHGDDTHAQEMREKFNKYFAINTCTGQMVNTEDVVEFAKQNFNLDLVPEKNIKIIDNHIVSNMAACQHGVAFKQPHNFSNCKAVFPDSFHNELARMGSVVTKTSKPNRVKAKQLARFIKGPVRMFAAAPGNDLKFFVENLDVVSVSSPFIGLDPQQQAEYIKRVNDLSLTVQNDVNVCCDQCVGKGDTAYVDLGSNGDIFEIAATVARAIKTMTNSSSPFLIKCQKFNDILLSSDSRAYNLISLVSNLRFIRLDVNPSEVYINNFGVGQELPCYATEAAESHYKDIIEGAGKITKATGMKVFKFQNNEVAYTTTQENFDKLMEAYDGYAEERSCLSVLKKNAQPEVTMGSTNVVLSEAAVTVLFDGVKKELESGAQTIYDEVNKKALNVLNNTQPKALDQNVRYLTGVAGSGKTTWFCDYVKNNAGQYHIVVPYKSLCNEIKNKLTGTTTTVGTMISSMSADLTNKTVVLDEAFALSPGIVAFYLSKCVDLIVTGDPKQNHYNDENKLYPGLAVTDILKVDEYILPTSHSVPLDICVYLRSKGSSITTRSQIIDSVKVLPLAKLDVVEGALATFSNAAKSSLSIQNPEIKTVAQLQGYRTAEMNLAITGRCVKLAQMDTQNYVSLTRHTRNINIYSSGPDPFGVEKLIPENVVGHIHPKVFQGPHGSQTSSGVFFRL